MKHMDYHFKIHKEDIGFWAECIEFPGCFTQASTKEELEANMREALELCLMDQTELPVSRQLKITKSIVRISV